jgi:hypothetical protein
LRRRGDRSRVRDGGLLFLKPGDGEASPPVLLRLLLLLTRQQRDALFPGVRLAASETACSGAATAS